MRGSPLILVPHLQDGGRVICHTNSTLAGAGVAAFLDSSLWTWTGNRQTNRMRGLYLASVLAQDIAFFDTSATGTGGMLQVWGEIGGLLPQGE